MIKSDWCKFDRDWVGDAGKASRRLKKLYKSNLEQKPQIISLIICYVCYVLKALFVRPEKRQEKCESHRASEPIVRFVCITFIILFLYFYLYLQYKPRKKFLCLQKYFEKENVLITMPYRCSFIKYLTVGVTCMTMTKLGFAGSIFFFFFVLVTNLLASDALVLEYLIKSKPLATE